MTKSAQHSRTAKRPHGRLAKLFCKLEKCSKVMSSPLASRANTDDTRHFAICVRALFLCLICLLGYFYVTGCTYNLMVIKNDLYDTRGIGKTARSKETRGLRGLIFDCNGNVLASNINTRKVMAEPKRILEDDQDDVIDVLARRLHLNHTDLKEKFRKVIDAPVTTVIPCNLTAANAEVISHWNLPNVTLVKTPGGKTNHELHLLPKSFTPEELEWTLSQLSKAICISVKDMQMLIDKSLKRPCEITVESNVDYEVSLALEADLKELVRKLKERDKLQKKGRKWHTTGVRFISYELRYYPQNERLANVLGSIEPNPPAKKIDGKIVVPKVPIAEGVDGIEKLMDDVLRPTTGKIVSQRSTNGAILSPEAIQETPAHNGADVYLTIDSTIQQFAEEELGVLMKEDAPARAYAVMMKPQTGAIMAMAQYPTFNPNDRASCTDPCGFQNHLMNEVFEPGSIMKPIPISYAVDKNITTMSRKYFCEHKYWHYKGKLLQDTHDIAYADASEIIMMSSNIGTAKIALDIGEERLFNAFAQFGLGQRTNPGFYPENRPPMYFSAESKGIVRPLERWDALSITRFPIGQGIACTPLQMLRAYGAIANKGCMMQPYLIDKVVTPEQTICSVPKVVGHPISEATADKVTSALIRVVNDKHGTGKRAAIKGYTVAGKTGTGQVWEGKGYAAKIFNSSFIGFVPAENPQFVLIVTAKRIHGKQGGAACAPVFHRIAQRTLDYLDIPPEASATAPIGNKITRR